MESIQDYDAKMAWEQDRAADHCAGREGCTGPKVHNIGHGPDGGGRMVVSACDTCAHRIRKAIPQMRVNDQALTDRNN